MTTQHSTTRAASPRQRTNRRGFSLIESIATMVVLAVVLSSTSRLILVATDGYTSAAIRNQMHVELSITMDRIIRELQQIELKAQEEPAPNIATVTASSITWNTDYSLSLSGDQLLLTEDGGTPRVLLDDVSAFSVQCFTEANASMSASLSGSGTDGIRRVVITISSTRTGITESLRTKLFIRACMAGGGAA